MDRLISRGFMLRFAYCLPPFLGIMETVQSSPEQIIALQSELQKLITKKIISMVLPIEE